MAELSENVLTGRLGPEPSRLVATSVFWLHHGTRLRGGGVTYLNQYVLVRVGEVFGACAFESGELDPSVCHSASGSTLQTLLKSESSPLRTAALDAYLAHLRPHHAVGEAEEVLLPAGTPEVRASARDAAIAEILEVDPGKKVGLIGVVNPLVAAIRSRGAECLPCDLTLRETHWGDPVARSMSGVLDEADAIVATGMTVGNGSFDEILRRCRQRDIPLVVYAQSASAVARAFVGHGVSAVSAEPFPFSQFSAQPTSLYRYRADARAGVSA
ncbi:Rossmann-like domain-containing protein [Allosaccharopolyspora coralli]|uniref:Rossmann-like domain-containing protein n=1 Tax=Allosaccharopolyspora coralli TaxID=2665642 RepID=UPI001E407B37|nr:DUF364 domain-containing protein [Allosaccharopolyspora coralli]